MGHKLAIIGATGNVGRELLTSVAESEIIKVDERLNICYMVYSGDILRILPDPTSVDIMWYSPISNIGPMSQEDSVFVVSVIPTLLISVADGDVFKLIFMTA